MVARDKIYRLHKYQQQMTLLVLLLGSYKDAAFIFIQSSSLALMSISRSKGNWAFGNMLLFDNINKSTLFASMNL